MAVQPGRCGRFRLRARRVARLPVLALTGWAVLVQPAKACDLATGPALASALVDLAPGGDLRLASGEVARLAGVRLVSPGQAAPLVARWQGLVPRVLAADAVPDRWGRWLVMLAAAPERDLAVELLRGGLAIAWTAELPPNCRIRYLQAEESARRARLGLWSEMNGVWLNGADGSKVAALAGQLAVVQGRVMHVGQTRRATYLNFGARGTGASAEIGVAAWRLLERQGWTVEALRGQNVRVRGIVSEGRPARLLVGDASAVEKLD